jgi:hypothetical protein
MKPFFFRCCKVTFETKRSVRFIKGDEQHVTETLVSIQFETPEELTGPTLHGHAYASITLSDEQYQEYPYRVGKLYALGLVPETTL